ncbi:MAG: DUF402 domain-containing protein [Anaerolineales bacterium]|nr:MAG: DUF402 domain-containing protein [Anaerolineales bacterium]
MMKIGDRIPVRACKADGTVYRSWTAMIESVTTDSIVTIGRAGSFVHNVNGGTFKIENHLRAYYWFDRFYNLIEVFETTGELLEIYVNIGSPAKFENGVLHFEDYELDVSKYPPNPAEIVDDDEFAEAVVKYSYPQEFQEKMYAVARKALEIADNWQAKPCPFGETHA